MKKVLVILFIFVLCIVCEDVFAYEYYKIGDEVTYKGDTYHVIDYSDEDTEYVTLLKDKYLSTSQIDKYKGDIPVNDRIKVGTLPYYDFNDKYVTDYNATKIRKVVDLWAESKFGNNLVEINGYKARLLDAIDLSYLGYARNQNCQRSSTIFQYQIKDSNTTWKRGYECKDNDCYYTFTFNNIKYRSCLNASFQEDGNIKICEMNSDNNYQLNLLDFVNVEKQITTCEIVSYNDNSLVTSNSYPWINGDKFWTMMPSHIGDFEGIYYYDGEKFYYSIGHSDAELVIRPVINVKKSLFGDRTDYSIGDEIVYNDEVYNVLYQTNNEDQYVVLLKKEPLLSTDIINNLSINQDGLFEYYYASDCKYGLGIYNNCTNDFQKSIVKKIIDNWYNDNISKAHQYKVDDEYVRLLTYEELIQNFGYTKREVSNIEVFATEDTPDWIYDPSYSYWINGVFLDNFFGASAVSKYITLLDVFDVSRIRPVIYLSKCGLGDLDCSNLVCREGTIPVKNKKNVYREYKSGDIVSLNNENYIVVKDSSKRVRDLTLLKAESLTDDDIKNIMIQIMKVMKYHSINLMNVILILL